MKKVLFVTMLMLLVMAPAFAGTGNWVVNGDFEQGLTGWTWGQTPLFGGGTIAPSIFNDANPLKLTAYDGTQSGADLIDWAYTLDGGNAIGWAREGAAAADGQAWSYVYQTMRVKPGSYTIDQNATMWDVIAATSGNTQRFTGMCLVRVDGQIGTPYSGAAGTFALRSSKWDFQDPSNSWFRKQFNGGAPASFTTTTGNVQIILAYEDHATATLGLGSDIGYAAFDNFNFETLESHDAVPEPSSLLALFSGMTGLVGLAIRRRR